jgi:hypothetical protein
MLSHTANGCFASSLAAAAFSSFAAAAFSSFSAVALIFSDLVIRALRVNLRSVFFGFAFLAMVLSRRYI